jgi:hypothetical protein
METNEPDKQKKPRPVINPAKIYIQVAVLLVTALALIYLFNSSDLAGFRKTAYFTITNNLIIDAFLSYPFFSYRSKKEFRADEWTAYIISIAVIWLNMLLSNRTVTSIFLFIGLFFVFYAAIYKIIRPARKEFAIFFIGCLLFIFSVFPIMRLKVVSSGFIFWLPSLLISLLFAIALSFLFFYRPELCDSLTRSQIKRPDSQKKEQKPVDESTKKKRKIIKSISVSLLCGCLIFLLSWLSIQSLNYSLDTSQKTEEEFTI